MNKVIVGLFAVLALGMMGFTGCEGEKSAAPVANAKAWCPTKYSDEATCVADEKCKWKPAAVDDAGVEVKPARCGAK